MQTSRTPIAFLWVPNTLLLLLAVLSVRSVDPLAHNTRFSWNYHQRSPFLLLAYYQSNNSEGEVPETTTMSTTNNDETDPNTCDPPMLFNDRFGCRAVENYTQGEKDDDWTCIRQEQDVAVDIAQIRSVEQVWDEIDKARSIMGEKGRADLYERSWKNKKEPRSTKNCFSISQFNALAEGLSAGPDRETPFPVDDANHPNYNNLQSSSDNEKNTFGGFSSLSHPDIILDFSLRRWRLLEVLLTADEGKPCHIMAVEEMDRYSGFFAPLLALFGYQGLFVPKTRSPAMRMGWYSDGCAVFWNATQFEELGHFQYEYKVGNQVACTVKLRHKASKQIILVAVTHLKARCSETNESIRMQQVRELVGLVQDTARNMSSSLSDEKTEIPTLIVGDFNTDPPSACQYEVSALQTLIDQKFYQSAYPIDVIEASLYTTWKTRGRETFKRVIDYIFFGGGLECCATLELPAESEMEPSKLPGLRYPSDHMLIAARFEFE